MKIFKIITDRWNGEGGHREMLSLAFPLILSTGAWSIQHFVDRMFLTWHSTEAVAAAMPAGMLSFTILSLFIGTAIYVNTFIAQYYGAERYNRIGPVLWQGIYVAIFGGLIHLILIPLAQDIFRIVGHDPEVQKLEVIYFRTLCLGAAPAIASSSMSGFFSGRGRAWVVMWANFLSTALNLVVDYCLIFGNWGFPELGIKGAAIGTVLSSCFLFVFYFAFFCNKSYNKLYHTLRGWMFDIALFSRLLRFGFPNGIQFFLDIAGFSIFILLVGRLGTVPLVATTIAFNINTLAFMPMLGCGIAVSILVGQYIGKKKPHIAERSIYSGFHITFTYMLFVAITYVVVPEIFIAPFASQADPVKFQPIRDVTLILLRFVALYSLFDTMNIIFSSAIKGAGDTRYVMYILIIISTFVLVILSFITLTIMDRGIYTAWTIASIYAITLGLAFMFRFRGGKWKSMRVIEDQKIDQ